MGIRRRSLQMPDSLVIALNSCCVKPADETAEA